MLRLLLLGLFVSVVINLLMFGFAYRFQSDKLTDASYAITFIVLAILYGLQSSKDHNSIWLLSRMAIIWALRIGGYLLYRVIKKGKDGRFDDIRENFWKFGRFWLGQALTVWVLLLPLGLTYSHSVEGTNITIIGVILWLFGFVFEAIADAQKFRFTNNPTNKGRWIDIGLWHWSRHPNYFGEILVWIGIYLAAFSVLSPIGRIVALISPIFITVLLCFISGIPPLEKSSDKKWGSNPKYKTYKQRTSILIPLPLGK
jgi:steroid 5-alpha reductase family enzyme